MKLTAKIGARILPLLLLLLLESGCTCSLWTDGQLDAYKEPAPDPHLHLYTAGPGQDILVVYSEYSERRNTTRPRAFWLCRNQTRVQDDHEPRFVRKNAINNLIEVPVFYSIPGKNNQGFYALSNTNQTFFTLYSGSREAGIYSLPVYKDKQGTVEKIALTPLAASADAVVFGGYFGFCALYEMAQSGYTIQVGK